MTTQRGWSHESIPTATLSRRAVARLVAVFAFVAAGALPNALSADDALPIVVGPAPANQSLTLDAPQKSTAMETEAVAALPSDPQEPNHSAAQPPSEFDDSSSSPRQPRRPLAAGLATRRNLADALRADPSPWYRSGLGATAIVVGVILLLFLVVRRWLPGAAPLDSSALRVAARVPLTPRHSLALVQVGRRFLLIGLSPDHVTGVCDIHEEDEVAELTAHFGAGRPRSSRFDALVATEAGAFSEKAHRLAAAERTETVSGNESWLPLADLRRRIRLLRNRGANADAVV